tara:strand:- start:743 stop:1180 length:438 start_codon:yes stop_codon:yes gene_type:complete
MIEKIEIKFVKTHQNALLPTKAYDGDNCYDIYAVEGVIVPAKGSAVVQVGLTVGYITPGFGFVIKSRSGLSFKNDIQAHAGEIDNGYRGDMGVKLYNHNDIEYTVNRGDRVAQFKVEKVWLTTLSFIDEIIPADRGSQGRGSSGQ